MNTVSVIALIAGLVATRFAQPSKAGDVTVALIFFLFLFFSIIFLIADNLTGHGFNESVLYHLESGITGIGIGDFYQIILVFLGSCIASLLFSYILYRYLNHYSSRHQHWVWLRPLSLILLLASLLLHPLTQDLRIVFSSSENSEFANSYKPLILKENSADPPNIVYIYLESLERTYMDEQIFPGLTKQMHILEDSALSFIDIDQAWGTDWTIAGMTASQCTIPLVTTGSGRNTMYGMNSFYPKAICLGDILKDQGFKLSYMGGAHLKFAGKGKFFKSHGFESVQGREELKSNLKNPRYRNSWGLYDDTLFDLAWEEFLSLSKQQDRFGLFLLTLDTHHPEGYPSASCENEVYYKQSNTMLDAVMCSDYLVGKLVRKIMNSEYGENTLIVLASDHLAMPNKVRNMLEIGQRRNLFMVLQKNKIQPSKILKKGTTLDIAPTLLSLLGYGDTDFGLGRDLLGDTPTLREEHEDLDQLLSGFKTELRQLWQLPTLGKEIRINTKDKYIEIDSDKLKLPVILAIKDFQSHASLQDTEIEEVYFKGFYNVGLKDSLSNFQGNEFFIWVDQCTITKLLVRDSNDADNKNYCLFSGQLGRKEFFYTEIIGEKDFSVSIADIEKFSDKDYFPDLHKEQQKTLRAGKDKNPALTIGSGSTSKDFYLTSQGGLAEKSVLKEGETVIHKINRGFNVFGISDNSDVSFILNVDLCSDPYASMKSPTLSDLLFQNQNQFKYYLVSVHDSAYCQQPEYPPKFAKLGRKEWKKIAFREPYIALIDEDKNFIAEYGGKRDSSIRLQLKILSGSQTAEIKPD